MHRGQEQAMAEEQVAAAVPVDTGAGAAADVETTATETDATQDVAEETPAEEQDSATEQTESESTEEESPEELTDEELADFKGSAGARIREMCKKTPGLKELL